MRVGLTLLVVVGLTACGSGAEQSPRRGGGASAVGGEPAATEPEAVAGPPAVATFPADEAATLTTPPSGQPVGASPLPPPSRSSGSVDRRRPRPAEAAARAGAPPAVPGRPNLGGDDHPFVAAEAVGTIEIPRIGLVHPIFEGVDLAQLHWGPGHWPGTAQPGEVGNSVFAGHRVTHTQPFLDIDRLRTGDLIVFRLAGRPVVTYQVTAHLVVGAQDDSIVQPDFPRRTVTLFACHPKGSAEKRYVIRGEVVDAA